MLKTIISMVLGGIGGYALYAFVGCQTGTCPITTNPFLSTFFGAMIGLLLSGLSGKNDTKEV